MNSHPLLQNNGMMETVLQDNNAQHLIENKLNWNANYDGQNANINLDVKNNGEKKKYLIELDNNDLQNLLNVPVNNAPLDKRLEMDFLMNPQQMPTSRALDIQFIQQPQQIQSQNPFQLDNSLTTLNPQPIFHGVPIDEIDSLPSMPELNADFAPDTSFIEKRTRTPAPKTAHNPFSDNSVARGKGAKTPSHKKSKNPFSDTSVARGLKSLKRIFTKRAHGSRKKRQNAKSRKQQIIF
jgi:hypothetical protein